MALQMSPSRCGRCACGVHACMSYLAVPGGNTSEPDDLKLELVHLCRMADVVWLSALPLPHRDHSWPRELLQAALITCTSDTAWLPPAPAQSSSAVSPWHTLIPTTSLALVMRNALQQ
jgi:hypothetical protein